MIDLLLKLLEITESKHPDALFLKGSHEIPLTWKKALKQRKMMRYD